MKPCGYGAHGDHDRQRPPCGVLPEGKDAGRAQMQKLVEPASQCGVDTLMMKEQLLAHRPNRPKAGYEGRVRMSQWMHQ